MNGKIANEFIENTKLNELTIKNYGFNIGRFKDRFTKVEFKSYPEAQKIPLKEPLIKSNISKLIKARRSCRNFSGKQISLKKFSELILSSYQMLFERDRVYYSTIPSAGAMQSLEMYILPFNIGDLDSNIFHYYKLEKSLELISTNKYKPEEIDKFILTEGIINNSNAVIIITSLIQNVIEKYRDRGLQFIYEECGYLQQNISLVAEELGLKTLIIGGFFEEEILKLLGIKNRKEVVIGVILIGR